MRDQKGNLPHLKRSVSIAGITNHSRSTATRIVGRQNDGIYQPIRPAHSRKDYRISQTHPYPQGIGKTASNAKSKTISLKQRRHLSRGLEVDDLRFLQADTLSKEKSNSVLEVARRLQSSLQMERAQDESQRDNYQNSPLHATSQESYSSRDIDTNGNTRILRDITNVKKHSDSDTESEHEDNAISAPCFSHEFPFNDEEECRNDTDAIDFPTNDNENEGKLTSQGCENQFAGERTLSLNDEGDVYDIFKLDTSSMFDPFDFDYETKLSDLCAESLKMGNELEATSERNCEMNNPTSDEHEDSYFRDSLCIESPRKELDENRPLRPYDFRTAMTLQEHYTCIFCGSNLEIIPFGDTMVFPGFNDFCHSEEGDFYHGLRPSAFPMSSDSNLFCPLCCCTRLVQNYNTTRH